MKSLINWFEIPAKDINRAAEFYNALFALKMEVVDCGPESYVFFPEENFAVSGMISQAPEFHPGPDGPILYFHAFGRIDSLISAAEAAGGKILRGKTKIEVEGRGSFALIQDTEGNRIGLYEP